MEDLAEDIKLFEGLKVGDRKAIRSIYSAYLEKVDRMVRNNSGTSTDAHDIFQETLETILLKVDTVHTSFGGMLIKIARFKWLDKLKEKKKRGEVSFDALSIHKGGTESEHLYHEEELAMTKFRIMEECFEQLTKICQGLLSLIKKGVPTDEIVAQLEFESKNTYYRRKFACMERWSTLAKAHPSYQLIVE